MFDNLRGTFVRSLLRLFLACCDLLSLDFISRACPCVGKLLGLRSRFERDWARLGFCAFVFFDVLGLPKQVRICLTDIIIVTYLLFITTKMLLFTFLFSVY